MNTPTSPTKGAPVTALAASIVLALSIVFISQAGWANAWYSAFKAIHVLAAITWIGGGTLLVILGAIAVRKNDPEEMVTVARQAALVGQRLFAPAGGVVVLMGIAMMLNTNWGWGKFWIILGLVGYATTAVIGSAVLGPLAEKIVATTEEKGATHPETITLVKKILLIARLDMLMLVVVVVDMVVKPFA